MKTVKHEIKLERSVKIILGVFVVGILLHAFPIMNRIMFTELKAAHKLPGVHNNVYESTTGGYGSMHVTIDNWAN